ncbi:MAG TPA: carotenoid biosynthesis protein [Polyangiaceae bacterium]|nr:carotenoid biosynthesis protein [Polyangiaceae bacterium]
MIEGKLVAPTASVHGRFPVSLAVLVIFYVVGTLGILSSHSERFVQLSFANLVLTAVLLLLNVEHALARVAVGLVISIAVGFAVEALGVKTGVIFGQYHYTNRMGPTLMEVPLVIGVNWAVLVHAVHTSVSGWSRSRALRVLVGATAMTVFDWVMEPVAIRLQFWVWQADTVPFRNYLAWWGVSFILLLVNDMLCPRPRNRLAPWVFGVMLTFFVVVGLDRS